MKHKFKVQMLVENRGLLGFKKTVMEMRTIEVDGETYKKLQRTSCWGKPSQTPRIRPSY